MNSRHEGARWNEFKSRPRMIYSRGRQRGAREAILKWPPFKYLNSNFWIFQQQTLVDVMNNFSKILILSYNNPNLTIPYLKYALLVKNVANLWSIDLTHNSSYIFSLSLSILYLHTLYAPFLVNSPRKVAIRKSAELKRASLVRKSFRGTAVSFYSWKHLNSTQRRKKVLI